MIPILVVIADALAMYASYLGVNIKGFTDWNLYYTKVFEALTFSDVLPAFIKSYFFGFAIGVIGCYKGYNSKKGTEGVGRAANSAVVVTSLTIFILDLIAVQITDLLGLN
jgi:phospholipid/cholesterol/gamma-HCH transport system permease protein